MCQLGADEFGSLVACLIGLIGIVLPLPFQFPGGARKSQHDLQQRYLDKYTLRTGMPVLRVWGGAPALDASSTRAHPVKIADLLQAF